MRYPPSGYIIFSLKKLKFYGGWGPNMKAGGQITQTPLVWYIPKVKVT